MAAVTRFTWSSFLIRLLAAVVLVFATYNPSGYSWFDWVIHAENKADPMIWVAGIVLLIGWVIYLTATARSLGLWGSLLVLALFGVITWAMVYYDIISLKNPTVAGYFGLGLLSLLLAIGISWSHIWKRLTGQIDVDEIEDGSMS